MDITLPQKYVYSNGLGRGLAQMNPSEYARDVRRAVASHEKWRLEECLNLSAAENYSSPDSRELLQSDFVNRYSDDRDFHKGARYLNEVQEVAVDLAKKVFRAKFADVRPISGHLCDVAVLLALVKRGDKVLSVSSANGGYPGVSAAGVGQFIGTQDVFFPFNEDAFNIDIDKSKEVMRNEQPKLIVYGASKILFPHPIKDLEKESEGSTKVYDGSHVLGLIAGNQFQNPLGEGCSVLFGSTHKSFPGPQGGIILSNDEEIFSRVSKKVYPGLVDNIHWNRVAALSIALAEMLEFGEEYAKAVVKNSEALGRALDELGVKVKGSKYGYSKSHQVILDYDSKDCEAISARLEEANIIADSSCRFGTSEATRMGMGSREMSEVAELISSIISHKIGTDEVKEKVRKLVLNFQEPKYVLS